MSILLMSKVWKHSDVSGNKLLCLLALADWANDAGETWPSYETLARKMRVSRRSAMRIVSDLEESGHIRKITKGGLYGQNVYILGDDIMSPDVAPSDASVTSASDASVTKLVTPVSPNTLETHHKKRQVKSEDENCVQILSIFVSNDTAKSFVQHRRDMKKPMTENAAHAMLTKLEGHPDPDSVLTDSIANGWQGIFPEKTKGTTNGKSKPSRADFDTAHREYARRVSAGEIDFGPDPSDPFSGG